MRLPIDLVAYDIQPKSESSIIDDLIKINNIFLYLIKLMKLS